jgi:NhaP-type Na+/H+ and K+/H+ antiporter
MSKRQHKKKQGTPAASTQFASLMQTYCPENVILSEDSILLLINDGAKSAWIDLFAVTFGTSSTQEHRKQFVLERDMLTEELASVEATIGNLEKDIHQVEKDIAQLGQETWQPYQSCGDWSGQIIFVFDWSIRDVPTYIHVHLRI